MLSAEPHWANREASGEASYGRSLFNFLRTYDPATGRYLEADPIGLKGGINPFTYALNKPTVFVDPNGLEISCGGHWCGTTWPAYSPTPIDGPMFAGAEMHYFGGLGLTAVTCTDECGTKRNFRYIKFCGGIAIGASASIGGVQGLDGERCRKENYEGYFVETGGSLANAGVGADFGFSGRFPELPQSPTGVNEFGVGGSYGFGGKGTLCYYISLD